jgi:hypothetical protein
VSCLYPEASMARIIPGCAYENVSRRLLSDDQVFTKSMLRARASAGNGLFAARLLLCAPAHYDPSPRSALPECHASQASHAAGAARAPCRPRYESRYRITWRLSRAGQVIRIAHWYPSGLAPAQSAS